MRKINKGQALQAFLDFQRDNPNATWLDLHRLAHATYASTREKILIEEQNCYCGYIETRIDDFNECHLDHYKKRALFANLTFDWNNLVAACNDDEYGAKFKDSHYKSATGNSISVTDYNKLLNPTSDRVEDFLLCNIFGIIEPVSTLSEAAKERAQFTIDVFNLNYQALVNRRKVLIWQIKSYSVLNSREIRDALKNSDFQSVIMQYS
jgi:uncharacterized protein (TIGR02646 family)